MFAPVALIIQASPAAAQNSVALNSVVLAANAQPFRPDVAIIGDADDSAGFTFQVALKMRGADELRDRLGRGEAISDDDLSERYLPTAASYRRVLDWLAVNGLSVTRTYENHLTIEAGGSVAGVRRALQVRLKRVIAEGAEFLATDAAPSVPAEIAAEIEGVNGLQPYLHLNKMSQLASGGPRAAQQAVTPDTTISGMYFPAGILEVYQALPYLPETGAGTTTAILIDTFPNVSDLTDFWTLTGVPQKLSNISFIQAVPGALPASGDEDTLDTEYASGIGYGSKVRVYATKTLQLPDLDSGYQAILSDLNRGVKIQQMSVSLGGCEVFQPRVEVITENNLLSLIAAKSVTIFISSGDSGALECGKTNPPFPSWPSTSPFVTAVGGTHLIASTVGTNKLVIQSETGWSGSGGGFSNLFDPPAYQKSLGAPTRVVPDVAADADPATGVQIVLNGRQIEIGGTSAASPIWAGFASLINQARIAAGKKPLGQLNSRIYPLLGTTSFHDVIGGSNGYSAVKGYDLVTGIGSPVMNKLLPTLANQP